MRIKSLAKISSWLVAIVMIIVLTLACLFPENAGAAGVISFAWTIGLLLVYFIFCIRIPAMASRAAYEIAFNEGTTIGIIAGAVWSVHVTAEHFLFLPGNWNGYSTLLFMGVNFIFFGVTAYRCQNKTRSPGASIIAAVWCAMISIILLILYVCIMEFAFVERIERNLFPAFKESGMKDVRSYVVHNSFESAGTHLLEAPIIASIFGLLGIFFSNWRSKSQMPVE